MAHATTPHGSHDKHEHHGLRLWPFFLALLALTAAEVGLYEYWVSSQQIIDGEKVYFIPKFALVWLILVFTLPKAYIVLVYFMHLRFEKQLVVWLAVIPLLLVFVCVLPTLTDSTVLKAKKVNHVGVGQIGTYDHKEPPPEKKEDPDADLFE